MRDCATMCVVVRRRTNAENPYAPVAQPDRVTGYEPVGREFESLRARQMFHRRTRAFSYGAFYSLLGRACCFANGAGYSLLECVAGYLRSAVLAMHVQSAFSAVPSGREFKCIYRKEYATIEANNADLFVYIELFYNRKRLHSSHGYLSPVAYRLSKMAA